MLDDADFLSAMALQMLEQGWSFRVEDGEVSPTWFLFGPLGMSLVGTSFENDGDKENAAIVVAAIATEVRAERALFVCDVWFRTAPITESLEQLLQPASERLDSVEAISVQGYSGDGVDFSIMRCYRTRDDGTLERLGEDNLAMGSPIQNIFQPVVDALVSNYQARVSN
jgi:hypothetical protein